MTHKGGRIRQAAAITVAALLVGLATASFLPLIETNTWWIRFLDFPRVQLSVVLVVLLALCLGLWRRHPLGWIAVISGLAALGYHGYKLHLYSELVAPAASAQADCAEGQRLRVMSANVRRHNRNVDAFLDQVEMADPDVLLLMETDAWWDARLAPLHDAFDHRVFNIPEGDGYYGMHLFSKLDLISPEFRFLFEGNTPTVVTKIGLPGGARIDFIGLHPKPPLSWSQPTTMRDAHILQAALMARAATTPTIIAGDFNAVAWERVTRRTMRIGGLLDPRVGRGLYPTHGTERHVTAWPIDHVLLRKQFAVQGI